MTTTNENVVRLAVHNPIISHEELAAQEFEPSPYFIGFDKNPKAMEEHEEKLRTIAVMSRFAISTLGKSKAELIETVRKMDEDEDEDVNSSNFLKYLLDSRGKVEAVLEFIVLAECRFAVAMANVYSEDGEKLPPIPKPSKPILGNPKRRR